MLVLWIVQTLFRRRAGQRPGVHPESFRGRGGLARACKPDVPVGHHREGDLTTLFKLFEYKFLYFLIKSTPSAILLRGKMGLGRGETLRGRRFRGPWTRYPVGMADGLGAAEPNDPESGLREG